MPWEVGGNRGQESGSDDQVEVPLERKYLVGWDI